MANACKKANITTVKRAYVKFKPHGITAVDILAESHFAIHTYPESRFCSVDLYVCGKRCKPQLAIDYLIEKLKPDEVKVKTVKRGVRKHE